MARDAGVRIFGDWCRHPQWLTMHCPRGLDDGLLLQFRYALERFEPELRELLKEPPKKAKAPK
jgi:hypothetical protein